MIQTLKRQFVAVAAIALVSALVGSTALAAPGHGRFGNRAAGGGFGPFFAPHGGRGAFGGFFGGPGFAFGGPGFGKIGFGHGPGGPGGASILHADVLTPAASFLGITVSALTADLKGGKTLAQEATAKGKTADALVDAIVAAQKTVLDNQNAAGWITDAQETALLAQFKAEVTRLVNVGPPVPSAQKSGPLEAAADYIGVSVSDLLTDLRAGKSLADIATAHGKTVDGLVTALTAQEKNRLDAAVAAGTITAAQAQTLLTDLTKKVTDLVNNARPSTTTNMKRLMPLFKR
jgi:hypothetical protein